MKAAVRQLKDKERKFGNLENKIKDMEDEQLAKAEQYQEQLKSKQAIFQHQLDDSKRRQLELEEKLAQTKQQVEDLQIQQAAAEEVPTQDRNGSGKGGKSDSEEVLHLHEQLTEMHAKMTLMEN